MATADEMLSETERELAQIAIDTGDLIEGVIARIWVEDISPPMGEGDVLYSMLYTRLGDLTPKSGFTLWVDDKAYKVTFEQHK